MWIEMHTNANIDASLRNHLKPCRERGVESLITGERARKRERKKGRVEGIKIEERNCTGCFNTQRGGTVVFSLSKG